MSLSKEIRKDWMICMMNVLEMFHEMSVCLTLPGEIADCLSKKY